jgi:two-component system, NarL family, response regulator LiaR
MEKSIRIAIADDHLVVRKAIVALLDHQPDMVVVSDVDNGESAVQEVLRLRPDVTILDIDMPRLNGVQAIEAIRAQDAAARILVLSSFSSDEIVFPAIKAGAMGYLLKDTSPDALIQAIHDVHAGKSSLHPEIANKVLNEMNQASDLPPTNSPLTAREVDVLKLLAKGHTNQDIADQLVISLRTVENHTGNILNKLHLANRTQAALYALREGYAKLD